MSSGCGNRHGNQQGFQLDIVGGLEVPASDQAVYRKSTVALTTLDLAKIRRSFCSASLIGDDLLLTAAHCVTDEEGVILTDEPIYAYFGIKVQNDIRVLRRVTGIGVHSSYNPKVVGYVDATSVAAHDVALLKLESAHPEDFAAVPLIAGDARFADGQAFTLAGYGATYTRDLLNTGQLRKVDAHLERQASDANILVLRGPDLGQKARIPSRPDKFHHFQPSYTLEPATGGACAGDSGGPAYISSNDQWLLAGVTSFAAEFELDDPKMELEGWRYCVGINGYTDVRAFHLAITTGAAALKNLQPAGGRVAKLEFDDSSTRTLGY